MAYWRARHVSVARTALILGDKKSTLNLAAGVALGPGVILTSDTGNLMDSKLAIGSGTAVNEFTNIRAAGGRICIGSRCQIAQFVSIIAINHRVEKSDDPAALPWDMSRSTVDVGDDVWIGAHAVVLPGARIGRGAVIAAGAVVTGSIPDFAIAAGVPARVLRFRKRAP